MMKNQIKALLILLIIVFFTTFYLLSYHLFLKKVVFYKPFIVEFKGVSISEFSKINCIGYSPLDKKQSIYKNPSDCSFSSPDYVHYKEFAFEIPEDVYNKITEIVFIYGKDKNTINPDNADAKTLRNNIKNQNGILVLNMSDLVKPNNSVLGVFLSVLLWGGTMRIFYISALIVLLLLSSYLLYRFRKKTFLKFKETIYNVLFLKFSSIISVKRNRILITVFLMLFFSIIYFSKSSFTNGVIFQWSEHLYNSAGVNFAKGHGISRLGAMEPFKDYKFNKYGANIEFNYKLFTRYPGIYFFHNPPGYGLFIGIVYYFFGVNPFWVKCIQLLFLIIVASLLPYIGYHLWKIRGFLSGLIASFLFISQYYVIANNIHPQCLSLFLCFLFVLLFIRYRQTQSKLILVLFGSITALAVLTVISWLLTACLFLLYLICIVIRQRSKKTFYHLLIFSFSFLVPVFLWSFYASAHNNSEAFPDNSFEKMKYNLLEAPLNSNDTAFLNPIIARNSKINDKNSLIRDGGYIQQLNTHNIMAFELFGHSFFRTGFVFIATQTEKEALFHAHNEFIINGDFNGDWYIKKSSFYNNDHLKQYPAWVRVMNFYYHNPVKIITLPLQKLYKGFSNFRFFSVFILAFIANSLLTFTRRNKQTYLPQRIVFAVILNVFLFLPLFFSIPYWLYSCMIVFCLLFLIVNLFFKNKSLFFNIPVAFVITPLSLIFLTILVSNNRLYTDMIDFIFILCGVYAIIYMNIKWIFSDHYSEDIIRN